MSGSGGLAHRWVSPCHRWRSRAARHRPECFSLASVVAEALREDSRVPGGERGWLRPAATFHRHHPQSWGALDSTQDAREPARGMCGKTSESHGSLLPWGPGGLRRRSSIGPGRGLPVPSGGHVPPWCQRRSGEPCLWTSLQGITSESGGAEETCPQPHPSCPPRDFQGVSARPLKHAPPGAGPCPHSPSPGFPGSLPLGGMTAWGTQEGPHWGPGPRSPHRAPGQREVPSLETVGRAGCIPGYTHACLHWGT